MLYIFRSFVQIGANLNKIISLNLESCNIGDEGLNAIRLLKPFNLTNRKFR